MKYPRGWNASFDMADNRAKEVFEAVMARNAVFLGDVLEKMSRWERFSVLAAVDHFSARNSSVPRDTPLLAAVQNGDLDCVKVLLRYKASIEGRGRYEDGIKGVTHLRCTPLCCAAAKGNVDIMSCLIENGADVNASADDDFTPLMMACAHGRVNAVTFLAEHGADVSLKSKYGKTALHHAVHNYHHDESLGEVLSCLIKNGAEVNARDEGGCTPLMAASRQSHANAVKFLVQYGADVHLQDNDGGTALHHALFIDHDNLCEILGCLIKNGAEVNARDKSGCTLLMIASRQGQATAVKFLIQHGADVDLQDNDGATALYHALFIDCGDPREILNCLIHSGANVDACLSDSRTSLMHVSECGQVNAVTSLIEHGVNVNLQDKDGLTALHYAAQSNSPNEVLMCLIENGADANAHANDGFTPLMMASAHGQVNAVTFLTGNGADVGLRDKNDKTALHHALYSDCDSLEILSCLIGHGADVNACECDGRSPLMIASVRGQMNAATCLTPLILPRYGEVDKVTFLIEHGANVDLQDRNGDTALHYAVRSVHQRNSVEIVQRLVDAGASHLFNNQGVKPLLLASSCHNSSVVEYLINTPQITRNERIDALELLGASLATYRLCVKSSSVFHILENTAGGFRYIKRGMEERFSDASHPLLKQPSEPVEAYQNKRECQTLEELALIEDDDKAIFMESLIIRERILGKENAELIAINIKCVAEYFNSRDLFLSIQLYRHIVMKIARNCSQSTATDLRILTSLYEKSWRNDHPKEKDVIELLEQLIFEYEKLQKLPTNGYSEKQKRCEDQLRELFYCSMILLSFILKFKFCQEGKNSYVLMLLKKLSQKNPKYFGQTLLHIAFNKCTNEYSLPCLDAVKLLLKAGFNVNAIDNEGNTPLHVAVTLKPSSDKIHLLTNLLEILFDGGAHHDFVNNDGKTPMDMAQTNEAHMILSERRKLELKCISARAVKTFGIPYLGVVPKILEKYISMH